MQALRAGQRVEDRLAVASLDGTATREIVVTVVGANDAASIAGGSTGAVAEDGAVRTASGTLSVNDADAGEAGFAAVAPSALVGTYGSFALDAATGAWSYTLANASAAVQGLRAGQTVTDRLSVSSFDGTATQDIVVSVAGAADPIALVRLSNIAAGNGGFKIRGEGGSDNAGFSVAGVGDMNGDGRADIAVGARYNNPASDRADAGAAYVVWGKHTGALVELEVARFLATAFRFR